MTWEIVSARVSRTRAARKSPSARSPSAPARSSQRPGSPFAATRAARTSVVEPPITVEESAAQVVRSPNDLSPTRKLADEREAARAERSPIARTTAPYAARARINASTRRRGRRLGLEHVLRVAGEEARGGADRALVEVEDRRVVRGAEPALGRRRAHEREGAGHAGEELAEVLAPHRPAVARDVAVADEARRDLQAALRLARVVDEPVVRSPIRRLRRARDGGRGSPRQALDEPREALVLLSVQRAAPACQTE